MIFSEGTVSVLRPSHSKAVQNTSSIPCRRHKHPSIPPQFCYFQNRLRWQVHSPSELHFPDTISGCCSCGAPVAYHQGIFLRQIPCFRGCPHLSAQILLGFLGTSAAHNPIFSGMPPYLLSGFLRIHRGRRLLCLHRLLG